MLKSAEWHGAPPVVESIACSPTPPPSPLLSQHMLLPSAPPPAVLDLDYRHLTVWVQRTLLLCMVGGHAPGTELASSPVCQEGGSIEALVHP